MDLLALISLALLSMTILHFSSKHPYSYANDAKWNDPQKNTDVSKKWSFGSSPSRDPLTGLPNRIALEERLRLRHRVERTLLIIGIDRLDAINAAAGYAAGDQLLCQSSHRIKSITDNHPVYKLEGDQFLLILPSLSNEFITATASHILEEMRKPFLIDDQMLHISVSIGIAIGTSLNISGMSLLGSARIALLSAKTLGRNRYRIHDPSWKTPASDTELLAGDLRNAVKQNQLFLLYQPKFDLSNGKIAGAEALLRWSHPIQGLTAPDRFISIAENNGIIEEIENWVLNEACRQLCEWRDQGLYIDNISVNMSASHLSAPDLCHMVDSVVRRNRLSPHNLTIEVTESNAMRNPEVTHAALRQLHMLGVKVSLDDFGVGYSSLSQLRELPACELKLDRSFINDIDTNPKDAAIVSAIITVSKALKLRIIAEGVETEAQKEMLINLGCDEIQGFLASRPLPADEIPALLSVSNR